MDSLFLLDHLYTSRVKLSSFLYPLSIMTKKGRNCGENVVSFFRFYMLGGRNTCPCKEEMCFISLGGVLTSFFLYTDLVTIFTYIVLIFDIFIYIYIYDVCLLHLSLHMLFLFFLYTHVSYLLYAIYYFFFTLRCRDKF